MIHKPFYIYIFFFCSFLAANDETMNAKNVLEAIQSKNVLLADFKQTKKIKVLKEPILSSGKFILSKNHGVCFKTNQPFDTTLIITQDKLKITDLEGNQTLLNTKDQPTLKHSNEIFLSIFTKDLNQIKSINDFNFTGDLKSWYLSFKPKNQELIVKEVSCKGKEGIIEQIHIEEENGDITIYDFNNHEFKESLTETEAKLFE